MLSQIILPHVHLVLQENEHPEFVNDGENGAKPNIYRRAARAGIKVA